MACCKGTIFFVPFFVAENLCIAFYNDFVAQKKQISMAWSCLSTLFFVLNKPFCNLFAQKTQTKK